MDDGAREYLEVLITQLDVVRDRTEILTSSERTGVHTKRRAARDILQSLCMSLEGFDAIARLGLQSVPMAFNEYDDLKELDTIGRYCDEELTNVGLVWPPPNVRPPAIVRDLFDLYDSVKVRQQQGLFLPGGYDDIIEPIRQKACILASDDSWDWEQGSEGTKALVLIADQEAVRDYFIKYGVAEPLLPPVTRRPRQRQGLTASLLVALGALTAFSGGFNDIVDLPEHVVEAVNWIIQSIQYIGQDIYISFELPPPDIDFGITFGPGIDLL